MTFYIQFPLVKYSEMGASQNQPIILTNRRGQNGCEFPESISKALVVLQSGQTFSTYIDTSITGLQLKELIYEKLSHLLQPKHMVLRIKKAIIKDEERLDKLLTLNDVIVQEKIPPQSLSKIEYFGEVEDEISLEKGVVKMPCGHLMGRASIMSLLNCVVSSKKWEIICPHQSCNQQWDYTFCKKLAVLTSHEDKHFTTQFNKNWIQHFAKNCPGCNMAIINEDSTSNKVSCLNKKCKYGYFCYLCFKTWKGLGQKDCGNDACSFKPNAKLLQQTKSMILLDRQTGKQINIKIPVFRLCPKCSQPIEHVSGCKHMQCFHCKTDFCWICLTLMEHKVWSCGNYNQYCGQTAPVQEVK